MSMFDIFEGSQTNTYEYLGMSIDITITPLTFMDATKLASNKQDDKFRVILNSMSVNHPDETLASVKKMPLAIANKLIKDIFVFNDIPVPEEYSVQEVPLVED